MVSKVGRTLLFKVIRAACKHVAKSLPLRTITRDDGAPYLERFYLCGKEPAYFGAPITTRLDFLPTVFLHRFVSGDQDPELHNHPWDSSLSFILAGGYSEERRNGDAPVFTVRTHTRAPFTFNRIDAEDFHRVDLFEEDAWTVFITGKKLQSWGFWSRVTNVFVPWREHLARRGHPQGAAPAVS